jgi:hypothetical protein
MKIQAALNLAAHIQNPTVDKIIPSPFDEWVVEAIASAIK